MKNIFIVTSSISDIGKGWITGSIANLLGNAIILKIDPVLVVIKYKDNIKLKDTSKISSDYETYKKLDQYISPKNVIRGGEVLLDFFKETSINLKDLDAQTAKRTCFVDVSKYFCKKLLKLIPKEIENIVIEMGGSIYDGSAFYLINGIRMFAQRRNIIINPILLTFLISSDDERDYIKSSIALESIKKTTKLYGVTPMYVFVRNKATKEISKIDINNAMKNLANKSFLNKDQIIYEPEFNNPLELKNYLKKKEIFQYS